MVRGVALALLSEREAITIANAASPLLPGAVRGAQFHPRGPTLRDAKRLAVGSRLHEGACYDAQQHPRATVW